MAISIIQTAANNDSIQPFLTYQNSVTVGNMLIAAWIGNTSSTTTITDSLGNTWHQAVSNFGSGRGAIIGYAMVARGEPAL